MSGEKAEQDQSISPFAVFHVTEEGEETYFRVSQPLELLDAAASVCAHNALKQDAPELKFADYYQGVIPCAKDDFNHAVSIRLDNTGEVSGAFKIDFERSEFSALHIIEGWKSFQIEDVCSAMRKVSEVEGLDKDEMYRVLTDELYGKELSYEPPHESCCSVLHVTSKDQSRYVLTESPLRFHEVAEGLRHYLGMSRQDRPPSFANFYSGTPITPAQFDSNVSLFLGNASGAAGIYDVNLDTGKVYTLRVGQGWERYTVNDVCYAAWRASLEQTFDAQEKRFCSEIKEKHFARIPAAVFNHAVTVQGDNLQFAVFHVTENKNEEWYSVPGPLESVYAADVLRKYLNHKNENSTARFSRYFREGQPMSRNDYEWYTANMLGRRDIVTQVYDIDLDQGMFSTLAEDGWHSYASELVCGAAYQAMDLHRLSPVPEQQRFQDRIAGQEIQREELKIYIRGGRRLNPSEISFTEPVEQVDSKLNFYMDVYFPPDAVLGTDVGTSRNDDYVNIYANYDLEKGEPCGEMEVMLWRGDGSCLHMHYRLNEEEKEVLLPKMSEHCQWDTGLTMYAWHEQYLAETEHPHLDTAELTESVKKAMKSADPLQFNHAISIQLEPGEWKECHSFREYASTMQYPEQTGIQIPEDTAKLLTLLVNEGLVTPTQAYDTHSDYAFDDDGHEILRWPAVEDAAAHLGFPELADTLRRELESQWEQKM